jgi:serine carboxypeptidase-like clade 2
MVGNQSTQLINSFLEVQLGNPETSDAEDWRGLVDYAWSHAVISDETHKIIKTSCDFNGNDTWSNHNCSEAVDEVLKQYGEIDIYSLYTSVCIANSAGSDKSMQAVMKRTSKMVRNNTYFWSLSSHYN